MKDQEAMGEPFSRITKNPDRRQKQHAQVHLNEPPAAIENQVAHTLVRKPNKKDVRRNQGNNYIPSPSASPTRPAT